MSSNSSPHTVKWGILATGMIAQKFAKDLLLDPSTRGVGDIRHEIAAAASSSSQSRADSFLKDIGAPSSAKAYGSYKELVEDPNVDIIYVATPHSHHYQNTRLCLENGKHVLCEKAFTVNAAQAKKLVEIARAKKLFLMEAVWTRYFPVCIELRELVKSGKIGDVKRVFADLSDGGDTEAKWGVDHRMVRMELAGGCMLDLGIYSLTWIYQFLYHIQPPSTRQPPTIASMMTKYPGTGADEMTSILLSFPPNGTHGIATTNLRVSDDPGRKGLTGPSIRIQCTLAEIQIFGPAYRPTGYRIIPAGENNGVEMKEVSRDIPGGGMFWEADEAGRCVRDGRLESEGLPLEESVVIMETMDEVRRQNGLVYPEVIESVEYPLELK